MDFPKIACLIPTRGDRGVMLDNCLRMLSMQTIKPAHIEIMNDPPIGQDKDITYRYRVGSIRIQEKFPDADVIALIEDDDWYSSVYLERMSTAWAINGRPEIFGSSNTYYYHLRAKAYNHLVHNGRASAFHTMITPRALSSMVWPADNYPFTDIELWKKVPGRSIPFDSIIALGIKGHERGALFGGIGHNQKWGGYRNQDPDGTWLRSVVGEDMFNFYRSL